MDSIIKHCKLLINELNQIYNAASDINISLNYNVSIDYLANLALINDYFISKGRQFTINNIPFEQYSQLCLKQNLDANDNQLNGGKPKYNCIMITPITKISSNEDASKTFSYTFHAINENSMLINNTFIINEFLTMFSELVQNIVYHSNSTGYLISSIINISTEPALALAVCDFGIGIPRSLYEYQAQYPHYWNDSFAITLALKKRVSRLKDPGRGKGLSGVYEAIKNFSGTLWMRSGKGLYIHVGDRYEAIDVTCDLPGVQVYIEVPINMFNNFS